ncbi:hypothetical protein PENSUB_1799 [Penicillium subrubescens]|uniref:Uncharacterized protein n=1 Tax=Penicillium subrubescens TaxID=1316194 RepID=A0A1Q5UJB3_9EURO|nr:hypothetical protein PENSUB_1799 [Penicillium subrubescens]
MAAAANAMSSQSVYMKHSIQSIQAWGSTWTVRQMGDRIHECVGHLNGIQPSLA